jgi:hypothetical protein
MSKPRRRLASIAALALLSGCGPVEFVASGISDGTKYVIDRIEGNGQQPRADRPAPSQAPAAGPAAYGRQAGPEAGPPVTAAPVPKVGAPEPLR